MNNNFDLKNIFTCNYCDLILKSPVILPCSESICENHVLELIEGKDYEDKIKCQFCNDEHEIPKKGFPKDQRTAKLINMEFNRMDFGKEHL